MGSLFAAEAAYYAWMAANFSPEDIMAGLAAPEADRDGDGQRNRAEFIAGSDPLSATSLHCASFSMEAPGEGRISYPTVSSRLYGVEKFSEAEAEWFPEIPATLGSGGMDFRILDASQERAFYRVSVDLQ
ncbi:MAG: hypothetical protein EOP87_07770 [Verrucomicrobiaceae bacterium]|nr:MAG: hypothetical protein EOP87_07770 [Verrucomicrobiaceae bacterium]